MLIWPTRPWGTTFTQSRLSRFLKGHQRESLYLPDSIKAFYTKALHVLTVNPEAWWGVMLNKERHCSRKHLIFTARVITSPVDKKKKNQEECIVLLHIHTRLYSQTMEAYCRCVQRRGSDLMKQSVWIAVAHWNVMGPWTGKRFKRHLNLMDQREHTEWWF